MVEKVIDKTGGLKKKVKELHEKIGLSMDVIKVVAVIRDGAMKDIDKMRIDGEAISRARAKLIEDCQELIRLYAKIGNCCTENGDVDEAVKYYADAVILGRGLAKNIGESHLPTAEKNAGIVKTALVLLDIGKKTGDKKLLSEAEKLLEDNTNATVKWSLEFGKKGKVAGEKQEKPKKKPMPYNPAYG